MIGRTTSLPLGGEGAERSEADEADEVEALGYAPPYNDTSSINLIRPEGHLPLPGEGLEFRTLGDTFTFHL